MRISEIFNAFRTVNLLCHPDPAGNPEAAVIACPRCVADLGFSLEADQPIGAASCPKCGWAAAGAAWEIAQAAAREPRKTAEALPMVNLDDALAYQADPREEIWPGGILSMGDPTAIIGAPGVGKSRLMLQSAICTIIGSDFLGWETNGRGLRWMLLQTENNMRRLQYDLSRMVSDLTTGEREAVRDCLRILDVGRMEFASIIMNEDHRDREPIVKTLRGFRPHIVGIDPLRDAGAGDPNEDGAMTDMCRGIASAVREASPKSTPLVIHHGRTGAAEASKVFGDDAASFGRNSKVLIGWLRSQINVASAGTQHPGIIIVGCGKNSNGRAWKPFAARLNERTMWYERLSETEFNLDEWERGMVGGGKGGSRKREPSPAEVRGYILTEGGEVSDRGNLVKKLTGAGLASSTEAADAGIRAALLAGVIRRKQVTRNSVLVSVFQASGGTDTP